MVDLFATASPHIYSLGFSFHNPECLWFRNRRKHRKIVEISLLLTVEVVFLCSTNILQLHHELTQNDHTSCVTLRRLMCEQ